LFKGLITDLKEKDNILYLLTDKLIKINLSIPNKIQTISLPRHMFAIELTSNHLVLMNYHAKELMIIKAVPL
jgi:hypothetical protein